LIDIDEHWQYETIRYAILDKDGRDLARERTDQTSDRGNSKRAA